MAMPSPAPSSAPAAASPAAETGFAASSSLAESSDSDPGGSPTETKTQRTSAKRSAEARSRALRPTSPICAAEFHELRRRVRLLQLEVCRLRRRVCSMDAERSEWSVRYSQRLVIGTNVLLALSMLVTRFVVALRERRAPTGVASLLLPARLRSAASLHGVVAAGLGTALHSSVLFFVAALALTRRLAWQRNIGFAISFFYSLFLALVRRTMPLLNTVNCFVNASYYIARYLHLHGLQAFRDIEIM